jgi:vacuolar-type H+-ATPase subunit I/STV1
MNRTFLTKLEDLEIDYEQQKRKLEDEIEEAFYEKQIFSRELEDLSESYRYHYEQAGFSEPVNMRSVYNLLDQGREEGDRIVNQTIRELENEREERKTFYKNETQRLEDELALLNQKERGTEHEQ